MSKVIILDDHDVISFIIHTLTPFDELREKVCMSYTQYLYHCLLA